MAEARRRRRSTEDENTVEDYIIDFSKEEKGGGGIKVKDGTYLVKVVAAKPVTSGEKQTPGLQLTLAFVEGKYRGKKFTETLWATPKAYSRFRTLLEAAGKKVPARVELLRIARAIKGAEFYVELEVEAAREGYRARSRVTFEGFINPKDYDEDDDSDDDDTDDDDTDDDDDEEEDEKPAKKKSKKSKKSKSDDEDEDLDDDDLDLDEL